MDVDAIVSQLDSARVASVDLSEHDRSKLRNAARKLSVDLETPIDSLHRIGWQALETTLARIALDLDLFKILSESDKPLDVNELSQRTNADAVLLARVLRALAACGIINETGDGGYSSNNVSNAIAIPEHAAGVRVNFDWMMRAWGSLPQFLEQTKYRNPTDALDAPIQRAFDMKGDLYALMAAHPRIRADFNIYMGSFGAGRKDWRDIYPVKERIAPGISENPDSVAFVDVGGGSGHQAIGFRQSYPDIAGRVMVQDTPSGILNHQRVDGVEFQAHDFFTDQPIEGARAYHLRWILHNWGDADCVNILKHLHKAMKPGYSKLLVNEWIIPEQGASWLMAAQDINMMAVSAAIERTEEQWREILAKAGFEVSGIFKPGDGISESIIEAVKS